MKLYHGTTDKVVFRALSLGLEPRGKRPSNWKAAESRADCVYLTQLYAGYFAHMACSDDEQWGILEVDTDRLDPTRLLPDEDALAQSFMGKHPEDFPAGSPARQIVEALVGMDVFKRAAWFRDRLPQFAPQWEASLRALGNCCYRGTVPTKAITRAVIYDPASAPGLTLMCVNPTITIMNCALMRPEYEALTAWLLGGALVQAPWAKPTTTDAELAQLASWGAQGVRRQVR